MGNKEPHNYKPPSFQRENWTQKPAAPRQAKPEHGMFRCLVNRLTNEELEEHLIPFDSPAEFQKYLEFFAWREREDCIVNTKYLNFQQAKDCCSTSIRAKVYIQHIPVRLSDIQDIPFPENLYLLFSALDGFEKLYQIVGYFKVVEDIICMDKDGRVKVWLNSDLSMCYTGEEKDCRSAELEEKMVEEVVALVEKNTTESIEADMTVTAFLRLRNRNKGVSFKQAKQEISKYAEKYSVVIPNFFESVIGIFDDDNEENSRIEERPSPQFHSSEERNSNIPQEYIQQPVRYEEKVTGNAMSSMNGYQTLNRIPSYEAMARNAQLRPDSVVFAYQQPRLSQQSFQATRPRALSPIDALPFSLHTNQSNCKVTFNYSNSAQPQQSFQRNPSLPSQSFPAPNTLKGSSSLRDIFKDNRLVYSDSSTSYQLDAQLIQDMIRYQLF